MRSALSLILINSKHSNEITELHINIAIIPITISE